jgi:hypothetical protein
MSNPVKLRRMAFTDADGMMSWGWTVQDNYASTLCRRMVMGDRVLNYWAVGGDTLAVPCKSYKLRCRWCTSGWNSWYVFMPHASYACPSYTYFSTSNGL